MKFYTSVEKYGNNLLHTYYEDGKRNYRKEPFRPYLFVESEDGDYCSLIDNDIKLKQKRFKSISEYNEWLKNYGDVEGFMYYGLENVVDQFIQEEYPGPIQYDVNQINIASLDIEVDISSGLGNVDIAANPITCLTYKSSRSKKYWLFYYEGEYVHETIDIGIDKKNVLALKCKDEADMLSKFVAVWSNDYPDVYSGWNSQAFDMPYLIRRIRQNLGQDSVDKLSPWGYVSESKGIGSFGKEVTTYNISGMTSLDYLDLFKKFGVLSYGQQESYKLDHIAYVVLKDKKISYAEYGGLNGLWENNKPLYYSYNIKDTILVQRFEDEMALINLVMAVSYASGCNYLDALGTVHQWDTAISRYCYDKGMIVPKMPKRMPKNGKSLVGGFVKDPIPGMYKNIISFDLASLYPHLMMQYNMSPETFIEGKKVEGVDVDSVLTGKVKNPYTDRSMAANGALFDNSKKGVIPEMVEAEYARRKKVKKEMLQYEQVMTDVEAELERRGVKV